MDKLDGCFYDAQGQFQCNMKGVACTEEFLDMSPASWEPKVPKACLNDMCKADKKMNVDLKIKNYN